jgi:hypothetical protein
MRCFLPAAPAFLAVLAFSTAPAQEKEKNDALARARSAASSGDYAGAAEALRGAAEGGNAEAANAIGEFYMAGQGVKASAVEAARWFQQAADASFPAGMLNLGLLLARGAEGVPADPDKSQFLIRAAAEAGFARAQVVVARRAESEAENTNDYSEARGWFEKAAEQDNPEALLALTRFHDLGLGGKANPAKAFETCQRAVRAGSVVAINEVGVRYQKGLGVAADPTAAIGWFLLGAQHKLPAALVNLGNCFEVGNGVLQDFEQAGVYYAAAAKLKFGPGQYLLAQLFEHGKGTKANPVYAYVNYSFAATNGIEAAARKRDELKPKLSAGQLADAEKLLKGEPPASAPDKPAPAAKKETDKPAPTPAKPAKPAKK